MPADIDDTPYTLTEHLTELRTRLIRAGIAVVLTSAICLGFSPQILDYATEPLREVLRSNSRIVTWLVHDEPIELEAALSQDPRIRFEGTAANLGALSQEVRAASGGRRPVDLVLVSAEAIDADGAYVSDVLEGVEPAPFVAYLVDDPDSRAVKQLQLDGAVVLLEPLRAAVVKRIARRAAGAAGKSNNPDRLVVLSPLDVFFAYLKIALVCGLFLACPFWLFETWAFVAPGLYAKEKRVVGPVIVSGSLLFVGGGLFAYFVMFPVMFDFLVNQMLPQTLAASFTVDNYLGLLTRLTLAFGVVFELPLALALLAMVGLVTPESLAKYRKYAIVIAFIAGAFLTPADPMSQVLMAVPLVVFYEIGILAARLVARPPSAVEDED